jgi:hypothetical protein
MFAESKGTSGTRALPRSAFAFCVGAAQPDPNPGDGSFFQRSC